VGGNSQGRQHGKTGLSFLYEGGGGEVGTPKQGADNVRRVIIREASIHGGT